MKKEKDYIQQSIEEDMKDPESAKALRLGGGDIGLALARARVEQGISQVDMAKRIGVSHPTLINIEGRPDNVAMKHFVAYAQELGGHLEVKLPKAKKVAGEKKAPSRGRPLEVSNVAAKGKEG